MPVKHGRSGSRVYKAWAAMVARCQNPNNDAYPYYGGRGIRVCARWASFAAFIEDMGERAPGMTVERIDVDGNYEPSNCKWATRREQQRNRRVNHSISVDGITLCVTEWAERNGISRGTIFSRLRRGWSERDAVTVPLMDQGRKDLPKR